MKNVNSPNFAKSAFGALSSFQDFNFKRFSFTQIPLLPAPSRATSSFRPPTPNNKSLAFIH